MVHSTQPGPTTIDAWRRAALGLLGLVPLFAFAETHTHCHADEQAYFSCVAGKKTVSLCGDVSGGRIAKLTYCYGALDKVELEFAAASAGGPHFMATVEPDSPRAAIRELWLRRRTAEVVMATRPPARHPQGV